MTPREQEEYSALRATIRARGTTRIWVFVAGLVAWAALVIATAALAAMPVATLLPLLVLAGVLEAVFATHTGAERIGRYIQVFFEEEGGFEQVMLRYGESFPGSGGDPLFTNVFIAAAVLNFVPAIIAGPVAIEVVVVGSAHVLFLARLVAARREAVRQRAVDLERFQKLKTNT
jgi:hypothetical protein